MKCIEQLIRISSAALNNCAVPSGAPDFAYYGRLGNELVSFLQLKNGFYAFESALHVLPAASFDSGMTLTKWNSFDLWRYEYKALADKMLFFAEDAFGNQFCLHEEQVCSFDAETGQLKTLGSKIEDWATWILSDYKMLTGYPLLHDWQVLNGVLPIGKRLIPKIPFVLGGEYCMQNIDAIDAVSGMRSRGNLAIQIKDVPDGTQIEFRIID